jgi:hypothetical protein
MPGGGPATLAVSLLGPDRGGAATLRSLPKPSMHVLPLVLLFSAVPDPPASPASRPPHVGGWRGRGPVRSARTGLVWLGARIFTMSGTCSRRARRYARLCRAVRWRRWPSAVARRVAPRMLASRSRLGFASARRFGAGGFSWRRAVRGVSARGWSPRPCASQAICMLGGVGGPGGSGGKLGGSGFVGRGGVPMWLAVAMVRVPLGWVWLGGCGAGYAGSLRPWPGSLHPAPSAWPWRGPRAPCARGPALPLLVSRRGEVAALVPAPPRLALAPWCSC